MLSNHLSLLFLMIYVVSVISGFGENAACIPDKLILLSNCSFNYPYSNLMIDNRTLSLTVPYSLDSNNNNNTEEEEGLFIKVLTRDISEKVSLIHFNLNLIQCSNNQFFNWSSVESSSTLHGEFVRTTLINRNIMYLSSGITYLRNLTTIDCLTKTMYRTDDKELFQMNLKIESTLNDYCSNESLCYPLNIYQCDLKQHRCICHSPLQSYLTKDQQSICINIVKNIDQCTMKNVRCLEWCYQNSSSTMCLCPKDLSRKKYFDNNRAYCEGRTSGVCNSLIQCPFGNSCLHGICQNTDYRLYQFISLDIVTISIIISSIILIMIIVILVISICILRRQRRKKRYHSSIDSVYKRPQQRNLPITSDYDNIIYGVFNNNTQLSSNILLSNDDNINDTSPFTPSNSSSSSSSSYRPKIVYLGGKQQLTAIYA